MPAYVVLELAPSPLTRSAHGHANPLSRATVQRMLTRHRGTVLPASPTGDDTSATIAVPDMASALELAETLREIDGVASAYAKPGDELP